MVSKESLQLPPGRKISLPFVKMQALGNDFIMLAEDDVAFMLSDLSNLARKLCDRNFGIGGDGMIVVGPPSGDCQVSWRYYNSDGSTSIMCGNGLRCLSLYCVQHELVGGGRFSVMTGKGPVDVEFESAGSITTDLGEPFLEPELIPVNSALVKTLETKSVCRESVKAGDNDIGITCIGMGNPHGVIFEPDFGEDLYASIAEQLQALPFFPESANIEFVRVVSADRARVKVWERGCGATLACASGAAAVLVAGVLEGRLSREAIIELPGGDLKVCWSEKDNHVRITGPAQVSFKGSIELELAPGTTGGEKTL